MIEILGWATSRTVARQFMETCEIAVWDEESQTMATRQDIELYPFRPSETLTVMKPTGAMIEGQPEMAEVPGFHFNIRIRGELAETLRNELAGEEDGYWDKVKLKSYVDTKLGTAGALANKQVTGAKLPNGYEWSVGPNTVRLYDGAAVQGRFNVWQ